MQGAPIGSGRMADHYVLIATACAAGERSFWPSATIGFLVHMCAEACKEMLRHGPQTEHVQTKKRSNRQQGFLWLVNMNAIAFKQ